MHHLQIVVAQSKFPLLAVDGVVGGVVREVVLVVAALCSRTAHVWFAHTSGGRDSETAGFVEISCQFNPAPTTARARWWHERGMSRMQPPISFYTPSGLPRAETQIKKSQIFFIGRILFFLFLENRTFVFRTFFFF